MSLWIRYLASSDGRWEHRIVQDRTFPAGEHAIDLPLDHIATGFKLITIEDGNSHETLPVVIHEYKKTCFMKYAFLLLLWMLGLTACEEIEEPMVEPMVVPTCENKNVFHRLEILDPNDTTFFATGVLNGEAWVAQRYGLNYFNYDGFGLYAFPGFIDTVLCDWTRSIGYTNIHIPQRKLGDTLFLHSGQGFSWIQYHREPITTEHYSSPYDPDRTLSNFIVLHSTTPDSIIEGSFELDLAPENPSAIGRFILKKGRFRLKANNR